MSKQRQRTRIKSRIDELPDEVKQLVDARLSDVGITYQEIADEVKKKGYEISRSSVGRYALRQGAALQHLKDAQNQTRVLIEAVKKNPAGYVLGRIHENELHIPARLDRFGADQDRQTMPNPCASRSQYMESQPLRLCSSYQGSANINGCGQW